MDASSLESIRKMIAQESPHSHSRNVQRRVIPGPAGSPDVVVYVINAANGKRKRPPETPFPGSLEDNYCALKWLWHSATQLGVDTVPARVSDLSRLPPAFIGTGSIDLFVEEDIEYANRLVTAGVAVELLVVPGAYHGFDGIAPDATLTRHFRAAQLAALRRALD